MRFACFLMFSCRLILDGHPLTGQTFGVAGTITPLVDLWLNEGRLQSEDAPNAADCGLAEVRRLRQRADAPVRGVGRGGFQGGGNRLLDLNGSHPGLWRHRRSWLRARRGPARSGRGWRGPAPSSGGAPSPAVGSDQRRTP